MTHSPPDRFVHALVSAQAARTPGDIAVSCGAGRLTYQELESRANQLAWYLRRGGVGPEAVVGVCLRRSVTMVVVLLGILKAGGAYLPLDTDYPQERLRFMLRDSGARILITDETDESAAGIARDFRGRVVDINACSPLIAASPVTAPRNLVRPHHPAYIIYTSGSTGVPKGVMVHHRGIANHLLWAAREYSLKTGDVTTGFSSVSFDAFVRQIFAPLISGACVILLTNDQQTNIRAIFDTIMTRRVTVIISSFPSLWRELLAYPGRMPGKATALRLTAVGGESFRLMPREGIDWLGDIYNQYGPTECTIVSSYRLMNGIGDTPRSPDEIGRPTANMRIYVLDRSCRPAPVGVPGEAYIAGDGLARGYVRQPGLTAAHFVANPFGAAGERMYRSGDLVRRLPNGCLEFLGRLDNQVKLRGLRIELGEVESVLREHPMVNDAIVAPEDHGGAGSQLRAYVMARPGALPDSDLLREYLRVRLPDYMVPRAVMFVDHFPRHPNGKVDRTALSARQAPQRSEVSAEQAFADAWTAVLNDI